MLMKIRILRIHMWENTCGNICWGHYLIAHKLKKKILKTQLTRVEMIIERTHVENTHIDKIYIAHTYIEKTHVEKPRAITHIDWKPPQQNKNGRKWNVRKTRRRSFSQIQKSLRERQHIAKGWDGDRGIRWIVDIHLCMYICIIYV